MMNDTQRERYPQKMRGEKKTSCCRKYEYSTRAFFEDEEEASLNNNY